MNFPNLISFSRILVAPVFYFFFISEDPHLMSIACWVFIFAALTDIIDGWSARRLGIVTRYGEFLDPLADKILTLLALIAFVQYDIIPVWMVTIIFIRDLFSTGLRIVALIRHSPIETSRSAKAKTTIEMLFISYILLLIYVKLNFAEIPPITMERLIHSNITYMLALVVTLMALYSQAGYVIRYQSLIKKSKKC